MAKFYDYAYHEDEFPEKKKLTNEDIDFLVNLQKEMNTQGHIAQADPRFWVISDKERINYVSEDEDGIEIYDSDNANSLSLKEFATKLEEEILPEMYPDGYRFKTILHSDFNMVLSIYRIAPLEEIEENFPYIEDIIDFLNNRGYSFRINRYRERSVELAGNFFLTHKDAKEYLKRCSHHYSENAHTFAMTCESPEVQRLYKILHKTDFTALKALEQQPCEEKGEISDGYHTFNQLYHQRAILFATIINQNKDKAWKSFKHSDGHYCFDEGGEMFIVGIDTPKGSYTYHYHKKYWDYFDCKELECGKVWDGHTEEDVTRLLSLEQQPCDDCVSREQALLALTGMDLPTDRDKLIARFTERIQHLPPVTPQRPKGKWMECGGDEPWLKGYCCSLCNFTTAQKYDYCTCGAEMSGGEEDEGNSN